MNFKVGGLVENELELSLEELRALPSRTQITRHDCVEGWSCIGEWKGVPLKTVLERAKLKPEARYIAFYCADELEQTLDGTGRYYETHDLVDAFHPQTILAYDLNGEPTRRRAWRAAASARRTPTRLQNGEICDAHRGDCLIRGARARQGRVLGGSRL